jgi:hypothetical protein
MANDLKTMSDLFMGLMHDIDDDEDKKKGLIPGTNIPLPDPNSVVPPVLDQFQTPPPKAPYQDAGEYMRNYFASNQEALANREPIPRKDMLRADGTTKSAQGFLGPFPDQYGKMMTEQTIGVEIDGKEVQMPAIVPTTTPDEIELLASGNVNWQSPRGQLIQDKAVANYRDRVSRGLSPYYQDGEGDVPSVQEVPKPAEVGGPAYSYGNLGVKPVSTVLDLNDPNLYDPSTGNLKPEYQKQAEAQFDPNNLVEVGGPAYSYGNLGVKPQREVPELPFSYNVEDILNKTASDYIPKPEPTFGQQTDLPTWLTSPIDAMRASLMPAAMANDQARIDFLKEQVAKGNMDPAALKEVERLEERIKNSQKTIDTYEAEKLADKTYKVQRLLDAGLVVEARKLADELGVDFNTIDSGTKLTIPDSPMIGLGGVPKPEPEPEVRPPLRVVTTEETEASGELIGSDTSKQVDESLKVSGVQPGGKVVTTTNTETEEEEVVVVDENGDEKPGFLKSLWNGIKDIAKEGFEDPSLRRALFAYTASRVLGYDGVTLASAVLENEWQKQAAQAKADRELEKLYGEKQAKLILDKRVDPTKVFTVYDSQTKTNLTGSTSKDGTLFYPDNPSVFGIEAGSPVDLSKLRTFDDGRFEPQAGKTMAELQGEYLEFAGNKAKAIIAQIKQRNSSMESTQLDDLVSQMQAATNENILSEPLMAFLSTLPAGVDPNDKFVREAAVNGIREWLKSFESGQTVDSKDLVGFLDAQRMKLDLTSNGIPQDYFKIPADEKGEAQVGNNAISVIMNGIENSPYAKDLGLSTPIILSKMADIYGKKVINEKGFQGRMNGYSKDSFSEGDKSKFVSPFFAFVQKSFASDNEDIAELMAELKK